MKKFKNNYGISLISLVVTIVVLLILLSITFSSSDRIIDDSVDARNKANTFDDDEKIRALDSNAIIDKNSIIGYALSDGVIEVITDSGDVYGTGYYLIPGGNDDVLELIGEKFDDASVTAYKGISAPYILNYSTPSVRARIENLRFR